MNYYALFLNGSNYIERCLTVLKFISNPNSYSYPHITVRLFRNLNSRLEDAKEVCVSYINVIEPGIFLANDKNSSNVVYIRCESEQLENQQYKPDYPFSRLHITIYEGDDYQYAEEIYSVLSKYDWNFRLDFDDEKSLTESKVGSKKSKDSFLGMMSLLFRDMLNESLDDFLCNRNNSDYRIKIMLMILDNLFSYVNKMPRNQKQVESYYYHENDTRTIDSTYNDESQNNIQYLNYQLSFSEIRNNEPPIITKPVPDAIYVTPPEYAKDMALCAIGAFGDDMRAIKFGDSAVGTGTLFLAIKQLIERINDQGKTNYRIESAVGVDIDEEMAKESFVRFGKRGLSVIYGDAISPYIKLGPCRNMMIVNPPYNRHENIPSEYRTQARNIAREQTGIDVAGEAGLYVYHLLIMDKWLCENGVAVWLIPSIVLQSKYGHAVRKYLLNNVKLVRVHVYNDRKEQFENTYISTTIVTFIKSEKISTENVVFSYGESLVSPALKQVIGRHELERSMSNWRLLIQGKVAKICAQSSIRIEDLFEVKRGIATGANSYFVITESDAKSLGIPDFALRPIIPKERYIKSSVIESLEDGRPDVDPKLVLIDCSMDENRIEEEYPQFYQYLQKAKLPNSEGKRIIDRYLVNERTPWYKQEVRAAPMFLLTYMGRTKEHSPALRFILNKSNAIALNTYIMLYPKDYVRRLIQNDPSITNKLFEALNRTAELVISERTRVYSGGLQKIEPKELRELPIVGLPPQLLERLCNNGS